MTNPIGRSPPVVLGAITAASCTPGTSQISDSSPIDETPLTAGLDHVLEAVDDLHRTVRCRYRDVQVLAITVLRQSGPSLGVREPASAVVKSASGRN
jgi:hypothetical protein